MLYFFQIRARKRKADCMPKMLDIENRVCYTIKSKIQKRPEHITIK